MSWKVYGVDKSSNKKVISYIGAEGDTPNTLPAMSESGPNPGSTAFLPKSNLTYWLDAAGDWVRTDGVTLSSIAVTTAPTKTSYDYGDELDLSGIAVTATYSDDKTVNVTNGCTFSPANGSTLSTAGTVVVSISYSEDSVNKTASQNITVTPVLTKIAWSTKPSKTEYTVGDNLDLTGAVITATFNNNSTSDVTSSAVFSPADGATLSEEGQKTITASYTANNVTKTSTTKVTVSPAESNEEPEG